MNIKKENVDEKTIKEYKLRIYRAEYGLKNSANEALLIELDIKELKEKIVKYKKKIKRLNIGILIICYGSI